MNNPATGGRRAVAESIRERLDVLGWSPRRLSEEAGLGPNAVAEFLSGKREWPRASTRRSIETALGWGEGTMDRIARDRSQAGSMIGKTDHLGVQEVIPGEHLVLDLPPGTNAGYTAAQIAEARAHAQAEYLKRLREMGLHGGDVGA